MIRESNGQGKGEDKVKGMGKGECTKGCPSRLFDPTARVRVRAECGGESGVG